MAQITCPHCGQAYTIPPEQEAQYAGQSIQCTKCGQQFAVNLGGAAPPPAPPASSPQMPGAPPMGGQPMAYASPAPYQSLPTSKMAITALVFACAGFLFSPFGLVGLILGIIALVKLKDGRTGGKGLAIAGVSVGAVSMVAGLCMLSILLPSLNRARSMANKVKCASNMREIGHAMMMYANDNRNVYPPSFDELLLTTDLSPDVFVCPDTSDKPAYNTGDLKKLVADFHANGHDSYVYCGKGLNNAASSETILVYEPVADHSDGSNFLFGDGHVDFFVKATAQMMINELNAGHNPPRLTGH